MQKTFLDELTNLLADNQDKTKLVREAKNGRDLVALFLGLKNGQGEDQTQDHSGISDLNLKEEIVKHPLLQLKHLWVIFKNEKNSSIKNKIFHEYCKKYPVALCPRLLIHVLMYGDLFTEEHKPKKTFNGLIWSWHGFIVSIMIGLLFQWSFLPLGMFIGLNFFWYFSKGFSNENFLEVSTILAIGTVLLLSLPVLIPVGAVTLGGVLLYLNSADRVRKLLKVPPPEEEEEPDYSQLTHWPPSSY